MKKLLPFIIIVIAVAVASVLLFNNENKQQESVIVEPLRVETQVLVAKDKTFAIHTQGIVRSTDQTQLMAEISGVIASISPRFQVGSFFHVDEVLFTLESLEYQAAVKQAKAVVAEKKAQLVQETAKAKQAKMQWKDVSNATDLALRKPFVAEAKALLQSAEAKLERAQQILRRTEIKAPYDGIVTEKTVGLGQYVNPGSTLGKIVSVGQSEMRLPLKDQLLGMLDYSELSPQHNQTGCQLSVELSFVYKGEQVSREAEVCRSEAVIDAESRVHYLVANIPDPYLLYPKDLDAVETRKPLKIGTFVTAKLLSKQYKGVFEIPRELLRDNNQILMVKKSASGGDEIHFKQVDYFHADNKYIYINAGLKAGERISLTYIDMPIEGMAVITDTGIAVEQGAVN
ncbi:MAG: efflux RND transporter periplasmic adaptor subunit [Gammaproteobacteria bacterium]|nr:efflux RND transporter periplasmic adaptor subunit [Gammaproteobacteria bacterium]